MSVKEIYYYGEHKTIVKVFRLAPEEHINMCWLQRGCIKDVCLAGTTLHVSVRLNRYRNNIAAGIQGSCMW